LAVAAIAKLASAAEPDSAPDLEALAPDAASAPATDTEATPAGNDDDVAELEQRLASQEQRLRQQQIRIDALEAKLAESGDSDVSNRSGAVHRRGERRPIGATANSQTLRLHGF
jgi:uncharacterized coiled-coil protein SlyX